MSTKEQVYNWNEHRNDDPFKTALFVTGLTCFVYLVVLVGIIITESSLGLFVPIVISYLVLALVIFPAFYRLRNHFGLWSYLGGAVAVSFVFLIVAYVAFIVFALIAAVLGAMASGGQSI